MQTQTQIRELLANAGLTPNKAFGQNFLIDQNLMGKLLELAGLTGSETVLEVGPGTGSLTEELLARCRKLVAVEIDRGFADLLAGRFAGRENFRLVQGDILASKHTIAQAVLDELRPTANLVANLPYNIATTLVVQCLIDSWRAARSWNTDSKSPVRPCRFDRLTFTVQREVADRLAAGPGSGAYGPVSIIVALLGRATLGPVVPATAFWPQPNVASRIVRIDFDPSAAKAVADFDLLNQVLSLAFAQRRKQIGSVLRRKGSPLPAQALAEALQAAGIDSALRAENVSPSQFLAVANSLTRHPR